MFVNDEMLCKALKARKVPPNTAHAAEERKAEAVTASEPESAREAAVAPVAEGPKVMTQGRISDF